MPEVIISGAGPTGLMLAVWLARKGVDVLIVDKGEGLTQESRALAVQARSMETYDMLGLAEYALERGEIGSEITVWKDRQPRATLAFPEMGKGVSPFPYLFVLSQDENERLLFEELEIAGARVEWNTSLVSYRQDADSVEVTLRSFGEERTVRCHYLCGCDGVQSAVRETMLGDFPGGTYKGHFFVADAVMGESNRHLNVSLDSGGIFLYFPMKGERRARLLGDLPEGENLTLDFLRSKAERHLGMQVESTHWTSQYKVHHRVAERFQQGRVFLLGDAAHVHSPVGGQGMNTGLMDATNLGWKLAAVLRHGADPEILRSYSEEREAFARRLVRTTDTAFEYITQKGALSSFIRTAVLPAFFFLANRFSFVQRLMFRTISQTSINYRGSSLTLDGDHLGKVRAGDRLPWVESQNNYAPLCSCDWQVHVYGDETLVEVPVPVHRFRYDDGARAAGFFKNAAYLVRPDGYVGMVLQTLDHDMVTDYLSRFRFFSR